MYQHALILDVRSVYVKGLVTVKIGNTRTGGNMSPSFSKFMDIKFLSLRVILSAGFFVVLSLWSSQCKRSLKPILDRCYGIIE